jgi:hypothetical protein
MMILFRLQVAGRGGLATNGYGLGLWVLTRNAVQRYESHGLPVMGTGTHNGAGHLLDGGGARTQQPEVIRVLDWHELSKGLQVDDGASWRACFDLVLTVERSPARDTCPPSTSASGFLPALSRCPGALVRY